MVNGRSGLGMREFTVYRWTVDDYIVKKGILDLQQDVGGREI